MLDILISPAAVAIYTLIGLALVAAYIRDNLKREPRRSNNRPDGLLGERDCVVDRRNAS